MSPTSTNIEPAATALKVRCVFACLSTTVNTVLQKCPSAYLAKCFLISSLCLTSGCGFQLRGSADLPTWLSPLYISATSPYNEFLTEVRRQLESNELVLAKTPAESQYTLVVKNIATQRRTLAVDSRIDGSEFQLEMAVVFELIGPDGKYLIGPETRISATRVYQQNSNELSTESSQINNLKGDIYQGLALQIIWRLQALKEPTIEQQTIPVINEILIDPQLSTPQTHTESTSSQTHSANNETE